MKKVFAETFESGSIEADPVSITLVNNTQKTQDFSVATDCIYELIAIKATNPDDVARVVTIELFKEVAKTNHIATLGSGSVNAGSRLSWPGNSVSAAQNWLQPRPCLLGPNWTIRVTWAAGGASAGGTDADGLVVWYRKLSLT